MTHFAILLCSLILLVNSVHVTEKYKPTTFHETDGRIINGENATLGQFPWQTGIYLAYNDTYYWFCGGSIISEEWILTAAHCLDGAETAYAYMATVSSEFILHEKYNASTLANDIGLIKLDGKIRFDDDVAPIALSSEPLEAGEVVTVSGFGITSDADEEILSQFLNYITVTTITNSECAAVYGDAVLESMVCTSAGSDPVKGACIGDTGGPAVLNADTNPVHVGIASFIGGTGCEQGNPSGFTRTAYYRDWIKEKTGI